MKKSQMSNRRMTALIVILALPLSCNLMFGARYIRAQEEPDCDYCCEWGGGLLDPYPCTHPWYWRGCTAGQCEAYWDEGEEVSMRHCEQTIPTMCDFEWDEDCTDHVPE